MQSAEIREEAAQGVLHSDEEPTVPAISTAPGTNHLEEKRRRAPAQGWWGPPKEVELLDEGHQPAMEIRDVAE
jgi:hypothetical protein